PGVLKKHFDKIKNIVYNITKDFFIKLINEKDVIVVFAGEIETKKLIHSLFDIREQIQENVYNVILNRTEIYIYQIDRQMIFADKNVNVRINAENIEKARYILVPEKDIQKYIDYIEFHKNINSGGILYFNAIGIREEA
ncbi:MAG TPA: hypothetical protein PLF61_02550, partial [Candidatus Goldiibacteriota bacterium]|nr:hypothetical protein [Candidatus Goldiibacteriota bacterium]